MPEDKLKSRRPDVGKRVKKRRRVPRPSTGKHLVPETSLRKAERRIRLLTRKLRIAAHALDIYKGINYWQYRGVRVFGPGEGDGIRYTSLEVHPLKDGWEHAETARRKMATREPLTKGERLTRV